MKDLLIQIEKIMQREIKTANDELRKEFQKANDELRHEFQTANEQLRLELRQEFKSENKKIRDEIADLKETVYLMKDEHGEKLDAIFDYIVLNQEKEKTKNKKDEKLQKIVDKNQLKIWNLENRVEVLEKTFNS